MCNTYILIAYAGYLAKNASILRKKAGFQNKAEDFRAAAVIYGIVATKLESKIRHFRTLKEGSKARATEIGEWKDFFAEISKDIRGAQLEACEAPLQKEIKEWMKSKAIEPDRINQPSIPPRELTQRETNEATFLAKLDRASARKEKRKARLSDSESGDEEDPVENV
jgi:hypothetical protein